jgi:hypothetical protein
MPRKRITDGSMAQAAKVAWGHPNRHRFAPQIRPRFAHCVDKAERLLYHAATSILHARSTECCIFAVALDPGWKYAHALWRKHLDLGCSPHQCGS